MQINCPICHSTLSLDTELAICENGHEFPKIDSVYQVITPEYRSKVDGFLKVFPDYRASLQEPLKPKVFPKLPYVDFDQNLWKLRQMDLEIIQQLTLPSNAKVLDIGAWNGWLSNRMAELGHEVMAIDLFVDSLDGLGANIHYPNKWLSVQMNLEELYVIQEKFDLIIVNRSISYFPSISKLVEQLKNLLSSKGKIIITGVQKIKSSQHITDHLNQTAKEFEERYGVPFFIKEYKGFITAKEVNELKSLGFDVNHYPKLKFHSLKSHVNPRAPSYQYAIFNKLS